MIISKRLLKQKKISHGFFNRNGGKSNGIYKSLNCGPGSNDKIHKVEKVGWAPKIKKIELKEIYKL